jgi:hypothetical protein
MSDSVAKQSPVVAGMVEAARKGRALMGGTDAMRKAGEAHLPRFKAEDQLDYNARLKASWLFNGLAKTVQDMVGKVFDQPVEIAEGPTQLQEWAANIDMQGRDLSRFACDVFKDGFIPGVSFIMVDAPRRDGETTRAQAAERGLRPYLVHLRLEDVLGWKTASYGNVTALSQFRIMEQIEVPDPDDEFKSDTVSQVRVLDRLDNGVQVRLFRKNSDDKWTLSDEYATDASEITVVPFYAKRTGFFTGEPVLEDLADVNIAHWQSQSDQRNILHFARVPILFAKGIDEETEIKIGSAAVTSRNPDANLSWVEHGGHAIAAGRQDLKDLEFQMETMGLQLLVARNQTATGAALEAAKETSTLAMMADSLRDALEQALLWMLEYGGLSGNVAVTVNTDFGVSMLTPQEMTALLTAVNTGNLSKATFIEEMKRRGALREDLDTDAELEAIEDEAPDLEPLTDGGE